MLQKLFNSLLIALLFLIFSINLVFAAQSLTPEEKTIFNLGVNLGRTSYFLSDVIANRQSMGISVLVNKLGYLKTMSLVEKQLNDQLNVTKKSKSLSDQYVKGVNNSISPDGNCDFIKMEAARRTFGTYYNSLRQDIIKYYGNKYTWLLDTAMFAGFTNASMQSDYDRRLILTNYAYLVDSVPYDLPTSVITSLSNIATVNDAQLTDSQADVMKEASANIITYFTNPESYVAPATLKDLVGKWEGRLQGPDGAYHRTSLIVNPDLTGYLNVEGSFDNMPIRNLLLTQNNMSFSIKPYGEDKLVLNFAGKMVDDMVTGEVVSVNGEKGMWQLLKTTPAQSSTIIKPQTKNEPTSLDKVIGVWKGKILEESGAISKTTLYLNLINDSVLVVENDNTKKNLTVSSIAINNDGIKFNIKPQDNNSLVLTFSGKVKDRIIEGNALANDGSRGYWKLVKISDVPQDTDLKTKLNLILPVKDYTGMYDPVIDNDMETEIIFVANRVPPKPNSTLKEGEYRGYIKFNDGTKAQLKLNYNKNNPEMFIKAESETKYMPINLKNLSINDRSISFKTIAEDNPNTAVQFTGKLFGYYLTGQAINKAGNKLSWELISSTYADSIDSTNVSEDMLPIMGEWQGNAVFSGLTNLPVSLNLNNTVSRIKVANNTPLNIFNLSLKDGLATFIAAKTQEDEPVFSFEGALKNNTLAGKITNPQGEMLNLALELKRPPMSDYATGLWHGRVSSGRYHADVILNFLTSNKRIIIDDSRARTGRLELIAQTFKETNNTISFIGKSSKSRVPIEFYAVKKGSKLEGYMKSQYRNARRVNLVAYKSGLTDKQSSKKEITSTIEDNSVKTVDKQEIPDAKANDKTEITDIKNSQKIQDEKQNDQKDSETRITVTSDKTKQDNATKTDKKENTSLSSKENKLINKDVEPQDSSVVADNSKVSSKIDQKQNETENVNFKDKDKLEQKDIAIPSKLISDEGMYKKSDIEKAKKQQEVSGKAVKPGKKEKEQKQEDKKQVENNVQTADKNKSDENKQETANNVQVKQSENLSETKQTPQASTQIEKEKLASAQTITTPDKKMELSLKDIAGKWIGQLTKSDAMPGEIIIEFKDGENYMYVDKEGEKVPFKLFDFGIDGKNIKFKIKPSPDNDFSINFSGSMIQGVLSGEAIDPSGDKGQWFAKRP